MLKNYKKNKNDVNYTYLTGTGKRTFLRYKKFNGKYYLALPDKWRGKTLAFELFKKKFLKKMDTETKPSTPEEKPPTPKPPTPKPPTPKPPTPKPAEAKQENIDNTKASKKIVQKMKKIKQKTKKIMKKGYRMN